MDWLSEGIASSLITKLSEAENLIIVERYYIEKVFEEKKLEMAGIAEATAADAGKLLGANIIVLGEFQYFNQKIKISLRLIDVNTGKIEGGAEEVGELKDIFILENKLSQNILLSLGKSTEELGQLDIVSVNTTSIKAYEEYSMAKKVWDGKSVEPENIRKAIKHYEKALKYDKDFFLAAMELGDALGEIAEFDKALKWFKYALKLGKKTIEDKNIAEHCQYKAYGKISLTYFKKGKFNKALENLKKALKIHPRCPISHNLMGHIYKKKGEMGKAITAYRKSIEINPYNTKAHYDLGVVLMEAGETLEAIKAFKKSIEIDYFNEFSDKAQKYLKELS